MPIDRRAAISMWSCRNGEYSACRLANAVPLENNFELRDVSGATRRRGNDNVQR
jgi:hypothetical protein